MLLARFVFEEEMLLLLSLSTLFAFMGMGSLLGLPPVSAAFLAGVSLSGFPTAAVVRGQVGSLGDFFHPLFFVALGAILPMPNGVELARALVLAVLVLTVTPPLVAFVAERAGFSARPALASGLLLAQTSEFSLVVALQGLLLGQLDAGVFVVVTLVTVVTMITTPLLTADRVTWALVRRHPFRKSPRISPRPEGHVLLLGCGRHGELLLEELIVTRADVIVVDDDPALVERVRAAGVTALRGDISDVELLREVGADQARIVISTVRRREDNAPLLGFAHGVPILVRAFNVEDGEWIAQRGGRPVLYSEAAAEDFSTWFQKEWAGGGTSTSSA
jgi:CPA2 family monovalent cation:H+ antiporter-2